MVSDDDVERYMWHVREEREERRVGRRDQPDCSRNEDRDERLGRNRDREAWGCGR